MPDTIEQVECTECGASEVEEVRTHDGDAYCVPCHNDHIVSCDCAEEFHIEDMTFTSDEEMHCETCLNEKYMFCNECDEYCLNTNMNLVLCGSGSNYHVCDSCVSVGDWYSCLECDDLYHCDDMNIGIDDEPYCNSCHSDKKGKIHSYSYEPTPNFHHIKKGRSCFTTYQPLTKNTLYMGVELEIDSHDHNEQRDECSQETAGDETLFYNKEDGSLNYGFEIVSHPFTMQYFKANKKRFHKRIKSSLRNGFRSHDVGTCGMHIHVSKDALSNLDLFKIVHFMYSNVDFFRIMSNRTWDQINHYCSLDIDRLIHGMDDPQKKVEKICNLAKEKGGTPKYVALNLSKRSTVEFRIFRGTLNWSSYQKNIEFVHSLIQWIKSTSLEHIQDEFAVLSFLDFLCNNQTEYNHMIMFVFNKFYAFDVHKKRTPPLHKIFKNFDLMSRMNNKQLLKNRSK